MSSSLMHFEIALQTEIITKKLHFNMLSTKAQVQVNQKFANNSYIVS